MFTGIANGFMWIGNLLVVPVHWFNSLPFWDWQVPLLGAVFLICFSGRLLIHTVRAFMRTKTAIADAKFDREWAAIGAMTDEQFEARIEHLRRDAENKIADAEELEELAEKRRLWLLPGAARKLLKEADKCRRDNFTILSEIERLVALRAEYKKRAAEHGTGINRVLELVRQLNAANPHAQNALAQLNQLASRFDWSRMVPADLPEHTRLVMAKTLRMMAGTTNLNEARNACGRVAQLLQNHRMSWKDLAA
jgi:hypothetical protein